MKKNKQTDSEEVETFGQSLWYFRVLILNLAWIWKGYFLVFSCKFIPVRYDMCCVVITNKQHLTIKIDLPLLCSNLTFRPSPSSPCMFTPGMIWMRLAVKVSLHHSMYYTTLIICDSKVCCLMKKTSHFCIPHTEPLHWSTKSPFQKKLNWHDSILICAALLDSESNAERLGV